MGHTRQINTKPASGYQTCQEPLEENDIGGPAPGCEPPVRRSIPVLQKPAGTARIIAGQDHVRKTGTIKCTEITAMSVSGLAQRSMRPCQPIL
jgi:hypothetical protein